MPLRPPHPQSQSPHQRTLLPDRQLGEPTLGMADEHGFPQVPAGRAAGRRFWLDGLRGGSSEQGRDGCRHCRNDRRRSTSPSTSSSTGLGAADRAGVGSPRQLLALGVDLAADEARQLVPVDTDLDGPIGVGDDPAGLLTSASLLLCRLTALGASDALLDLQAAVANLVWEANTGVTRTGIDMRSVGAPLAVSTDRK